MNTLHHSHNGQASSNKQVEDKIELQIDGADRSDFGGLGTRFENSLLPLLRDASGESTPRRGSYGPSFTGGIDLSGMEISKFFDVVEETDKPLAAHLRSIQQDHIRPAFQRLQGVRREVDQELEALRRRSEAVGEQIDRTVSEIQSKRDAALAPYVQGMEDAQENVSRKHEEAIDAASRIDICHDPENLDESALTHVMRMSEQEAAWKKQVPHGQQLENLLLSDIVSWIGTTICGCLIGVSAALASGALRPNDLFKEPKYGAIGVSCMIGIFAVSLFLRGALGLAAAKFIESHFLEQPRNKQLSWFLSLAAIGVGLATCIVAMDRQGVLRAAQSHAVFDKSGMDVSPLVWWFTACVLSLAYLIYSVLVGFFKARQVPIANAVTGHIERDHRERAEAHLLNPDVKEALRALGHVREAERQYEWSVQRLADVKAPFDDLIARAEAQRLEWPMTWTPEMKHRVEDARENLLGIMVELNALINDFFAQRENPAPAKGGFRK